MSQYGMHMPGGAMQRKASMDVYTGLLFVAVMALVAASVFVWMQGAKVAPEGQPLNLQTANAIKLPAEAPGARR